MVRFIGIAMSTPSAPTARTHARTTYHFICVPRGFASVTERSSMAGTADTSSATVARPADDAVDCMQLFSRIVIGDRTRPMRRSPDHRVKDVMHAVRATPRPQPDLRPTYTFVNARKNPSTQPMTIARVVSCTASCPRNARSYHSRSSICPTTSGGMARGLFASISSGVVGGF